MSTLLLERQRERMRETYLYFIGAGEPLQAVKVGVSQDPERRRTLIAVDNHLPVSLLYCELGDKRMEKHVQKRFAAERIRGEWFRPSQELLDYMKALAYWRSEDGRLQELDRRIEEAFPDAEIPEGATIEDINAWYALAEKLPA